MIPYEPSSLNTQVTLDYVVILQIRKHKESLVSNKKRKEWYKRNTYLFAQTTAKPLFGPNSSSPAVVRRYETYKINLSHVRSHMIFHASPNNGRRRQHVMANIVRSAKSGSD